MDAVSAKAAQVSPMKVQPVRPQPEVQMQNQGMIEVNTFERDHDQNEVRQEYARKKQALDEQKRELEAQAKAQKEALAQAKADAIAHKALKAQQKADKAANYRSTGQ